MTKKMLVTLLGAALLTLGFGSGSAEAAFGIAGFSGSVANPDGTPLYQAGAHPDVTTDIELSSFLREGKTIVDGNVKDIDVQLPPGLIGNPSATPKCTQAQLVGGTGPGEGFYARCPVNSQVGVTTVRLATGGSAESESEPVYNMEAPRGIAARFGFNVGTVLVYVDARLANDGGYRIEANVSNVSEVLAIAGDELTLWGVPADHSHDAQRYNSALQHPTPGVESTTPPVPFLSNPTSCTNTANAFRLRTDSWQNPGVFDEAEFSADPEGNPLIVNGCERVPFEASLAAQPTTSEADSPTGLDVTLTVPQSNNPTGLSTADLKDATIVLPAGMTVNPSSVNGLGSCSSSQIDLEGEAGDTCPPSSKLGTVEIDTPLLEKPLQGSVYLAAQGQNKFGSLLAIYIGIDDPITGTVLKLPGKIAADSTTGRLTATFEDNPQLPFETLKVDFFGGSNAALRTPPTCGTYTTQGTFAPWSGTAAVTSSDTFQITGGPNGSACPSGSFGPTLEAASARPLAGQYSPLGIRVNRVDGSPALSTLSVRLPAGLLAKLAGVPYCADAALAAIPTAEGTAAAQIAAPSCPAASQVGTVTVGAGAGPSPFYLHTGKAYLAGPYKGAPLSLAIVTPALAGPFDLGNVVVRAALQVDPLTTQVTAVSDPIPTILDGVPLDLRSLAIEIDRGEFIRNPTNCSPQSFSGTAGSVTGASAPLSDSFGVADCEALGFAPKLALSLKGGTTRGKDPSLKAVLTAPANQANIGKVQVVLPKTVFIDNRHLSDPCTRIQFDAGAGNGTQCPPKSILGQATAYSPLLAKPLTGKVYFRSNGGERKLPDLVASLDGQIHVNLVGFIDSVHKKGSETSRTRTTFAAVPDAPVSKFVLELSGGKKGLLQNSTNLCKATAKATVRMTGQNGRSHDFDSIVRPSCGAK